MSTRLQSSVVGALVALLALTGCASRSHSNGAGANPGSSGDPRPSFSAPQPNDSNTSSPHPSARPFDPAKDLGAKILDPLKTTSVTINLAGRIALQVSNSTQWKAKFSTNAVALFIPASAQTGAASYPLIIGTGTGKTTVTLTAPDGATYKVSIKVVIPKSVSKPSPTPKPSTLAKTLVGMNANDAVTMLLDAGIDFFTMQTVHNGALTTPAPTPSAIANRVLLWIGCPDGGTKCTRGQLIVTKAQVG